MQNIPCHNFRSNEHYPCNTKSDCLLLETETGRYYTKLPISNMSNNRKELDNEAIRIVERMKDIEIKRDADIETARFMTSLPDLTNSYGQFALFEKSEFSDFASDVKT